MLKNGTLWYIVFLESFQFLGWPICFVGTTSFSQMHVSRMHHSRYYSFPNVVLPNYFLLSAIIFTKIPQADDPGHTLWEWGDQPIIREMCNGEKDTEPPKDPCECADLALNIGKWLQFHYFIKFSPFLDLALETLSQMLF